MQIAINGIDLDIDIDYRYTGFRMTVEKYDGASGRWDTVQEFGGELRIMQTPYEALIDLASNLFDAPEAAETMAELLGVSIVFFDDEEAQCETCDFSGDADEMTEIEGIGSERYVCETCWTTN